MVRSPKAPNKIQGRGREASRGCNPGSPKTLKGSGTGSLTKNNNNRADNETTGPFTPTSFDSNQMYRCETSTGARSEPNSRNLVQRKEVVSVRIKLNHGSVRFVSSVKKFFWWFGLSDHLQEVPVVSVQLRWWSLPHLQLQMRLTMCPVPQKTLTFSHYSNVATFFCLCLCVKLCKTYPTNIPKTPG